MNSTLDCPAIYGIINKTNGKLYVGSALNVKVRVRQHFNRLRANEHISKHFQGSFNKHGESVFAVIVLEVVNDPAQLLSREQHYLDLLQPFRNSGYNSSPTAGSTLGIKRPPFSAEWIAKISEAHKGEKNHFYGKTHSEETRKVISSKTKARMADPTVNYFYGKRFTGEQNYMFGKTHTPEAREKIRTASKGRKHTDKAKHQMSEFRRGRRLRGNFKPVIQLDSDGNPLAKYPSITDAAQAVKISIQCISTVLTGRGKTAKGFRWEYAR